MLYNKLKKEILKWGVGILEKNPYLNIEHLNLFIMAANGKTLEYLIKEGLVRVSAEDTDYVIIKTFTNPRGTQSTAAQTSEYAVKLSDFLAALEESADIAAVQAALTAHINDATDAHDASAVSYVNITSGLTAVNLQAAVDEVDGALDTLKGRVDAIVSNMYVDNVTALAGGLIAGQLYSTPTGEVRIVI